MDPRRLLSGAALAFAIAVPAGAARGDAAPPAPPAPHRAPPALPKGARPATPAPTANPTPAKGPAAIAAANLGATARSRADRFVGGEQVFDYAPGRIYEVWAAPLRLTSLSLAPGETVTALAAGDTVRWRIGETASGAGDGRRAHVLIKPLERGLETNLVLATSQRLYLVRLRSGGPEAFNPAIAWTADPPPPHPPAPPQLTAAPPEPATPPDPAPAEAVIAGRLDARYRIAGRGRRPAWTPTAAMTDGIRTLIAFPPALARGEAPALFAVAPGGQAQMVNYRQQPGLYIVDQVLDRAELRLGGPRAPVVTLTRLDGGRP